MAATSGKKPILGFGFNVVLLALVSFFQDVSSEMIAPLLPLFVISLPGASAAMVGLIEGLADSTSSLLKVFSGYFSDRAGKRKAFVTAGYGFSTLAKAFLPFASAWTHVLGVRFADRVGKGIRTAPRDAIIAASADANSRGRAFGFHRAMDTAGAVFGPAVVVLLLVFLKLEIRQIFLIALIPAFIAVALTLFVKERKEGTIKRFLLAKPKKEFVWMLAIGGLFSFGNISYAFFILKASQVLGTAAAGTKILGGTGGGIIPVLLIYIFFNIVYALSAMPAGSLSDKIGRRPTIIAGYLIFALCALGFAFVESLPSAAALPVIVGLFALYGVSQAVNEVIPRALVADISDPANRATTLGAYSMIVALVNLPSDVVAGLIWIYGWEWGMKPGMLTFLVCAGIGIVSAVLFQIFVNRRGVGRGGGSAENMKNAKVSQ